MPLTLSVIIPFYERLSDLLRCLNTLQRTAFVSPDYLTEFIVQDDCSPTVDLPSLLPPCVASAARNPRNLGFAGNCNAGAVRARGDVLFFVNQDVYAAFSDPQGYDLSQGWNKALLDAFNAKNVGIVGAKLLTPNYAIQSAGGLYDVHGQPFHRCLGYSNHRYEEVNTRQPVSWVTGAALAIRREVFAEVGGFDEAYRGGYFEDVDICAKVKASGREVVYEPACTLVHVVGTSGGNLQHFRQNAMLFKRRWIDSGLVEADVYTAHERFWS